MSNTPTKKKNPAAVALGKLRAQYSYEETHRARWADVPPEARAAHARKAVLARWKKYRAEKKRQRSA
jgi:hypothetical protein